MNDYLLMLQKYWVVEDTDDYWDDTLNAIYEFGKKYEQVDKIFAITMALAFVDVLEEKARQKKGYKGQLFKRLESDVQ